MITVFLSSSNKQTGARIKLKSRVPGQKTIFLYVKILLLKDSLLNTGKFITVECKLSLLISRIPVSVWVSNIMMF